MMSSGRRSQTPAHQSHQMRGTVLPPPAHALASAAQHQRLRVCGRVASVQTVQSAASSEEAVPSTSDKSISTADAAERGWEIDFCSRPLLDERGKKVWELLICDPARDFEYAEYFPNSKINSGEASCKHGVLCHDVRGQRPTHPTMFCAPRSSKKPLRRSCRCLALCGPRRRGSSAGRCRPSSPRPSPTATSSQCPAGAASQSWVRVDGMCTEAHITAVCMQVQRRTTGRVFCTPQLRCVQHIRFGACCAPFLCACTHMPASCKHALWRTLCEQEPECVHDGS